MLRLAIIGLMSWMVIFASQDANATKRVALVIGNSAYEHTTALRNPKHDARAMSAALEMIGFESITLKTDQDVDSLRQALRAFEDKAYGADIAIVFFAGHGMELGGENYLIPTDAKLLRDRHLRHEAVRLSSVMLVVAGAKRLGLVILDACRNNPFAAQMKLSGSVKRSVPRGFERPPEPDSDNVYVAYAARHGTVAEDGVGDHSPYTSALLSHLSEPGVDIRLMLGKVRDTVKAATNGGQVPHTYGTLGGNEFYLVPPSDNAVIKTSPMSEAALAWSATKDTTNTAVLEAFIKRFPQGLYTELAKDRLKMMREGNPKKHPAIPKAPLDFDQGGRVFANGCERSRCWLALLKRVERLPITSAWEVDIIERRWQVDANGRPFNMNNYGQVKSSDVMVICNEEWPQVNFGGDLIELDRVRYRRQGFKPVARDRKNYELWWAVCKGQLRKYSGQLSLQ